MNIIEFKNIGKKYGDKYVLKDISFSVKKGEIHAILGENGAGKSTLMNIVCGMPVIEKSGGYEGDILVDGEKVYIKTPIQSTKLGIGIAKQELSIIDTATVWENIFINDEITKSTFISKILGKNMKVIDKKSMREESQRLMQSMGSNLNIECLCGNLSIGEKHFVEIAREIKRKNINLLIFDEPTAVFTKEESIIFGKLIRELKEKGISIIFITHKLDEVMDYSDRITVLRNGKYKGTYENNGITKEELARLMIGKELNYPIERSFTTSSDTILSIKNVSANSGSEFIENVSLDIKKGEIFGIAGVSGQGRDTLGDVLGGMIDYTGEIYIGKNIVKSGDSEDSIKKGISYVSSDRKGTGVYLAGSIYENICISAMHTKNRFVKNIGFIKIADRKAMKEYAKTCVDNLNIKCQSVNQSVGELSGGNQQKVAIAKALALNPTVLVVSDVSRGVDIGAKNNIMDILKSICENDNITIVMISGDLNELRSMCDRIAVLNEGKVSAILSADESSEKFGMAISEGVKKN